MVNESTEAYRNYENLTDHHGYEQLNVGYVGVEHEVGSRDTSTVDEDYEEDRDTVATRMFVGLKGFN